MEFCHRKSVGTLVLARSFKLWMSITPTELCAFISSFDGRGVISRHSKLLVVFSWQSLIQSSLTFVLLCFVHRQELAHMLFISGLCTLHVREIIGTFLDLKKTP